ncbi:hypothetical protein EDD15DRAFT_2437983 [Pisolithus albus]|nr:hypothetical protein EDD15DRAFT_2437983 [Pisolithus albus]
MKTKKYSIYHGREDALPTTLKADYAKALVEWRATMPLFAVQAKKTQFDAQEVLDRVRSVIRNTMTLSWLGSVPRNFGDTSAGTIKADEWRSLATVYLPIALISLWGQDDCAPELRAVLDHTMHLVSAVYLACTRTTTTTRTSAYRTHITSYVGKLSAVYPNFDLRPNHHASFHIYEYLNLFGPVHSWWTFPFERLIGVLQRLPSNHKSGELEETMMLSYLKAARLRAWLSGPRCPTAVQECKILLDRAYRLTEVEDNFGNDPDDESVQVPTSAVPTATPEDLYHIVHQRTVVLRAHLRHEGVIYSRSSTHIGNSLIMFYPQGVRTSSPVPGSIKYIFGSAASNHEKSVVKVVAGSYGDTGNVRLFDISSGTQLLPPISHRHVFGIKFSPDGSRFATASEDSGVRVYSTHDGKVLFDSGTRCSTQKYRIVTPLVWSADGQRLFAASEGKITSFNVSDSLSSEWPIHEDQSSVSIASNGKFIACSAGSSVSLWDCMSRERLGSIITHTAEIWCIALSPSGGYLVCGLKDGTIAVHNLRDVLPPKYFSGGLPLVQLSGRTLKSWTQGISTSTEALLSEEIKTTSSPSHHLLACRAIPRSRLKQVALAMEDSKESLRVRPSPIGYIAMAVTLLGQGDRERALRVFDLAFHDCELDDNRFLLLLKSILMFESGNQEEAIERIELLAARANDDRDNDATYLYAQVLAAMHMKKGDYSRAIPLIDRVKHLAPKNKQYPPLMTISLIFGWSFDQPDIIVKRHLCESLYQDGRTAEAMEILRNMMKTSDEDAQGSKTNADWIADFIQKCVITRERAGDGASGSSKHDVTATQSNALS